MSPVESDPPVAIESTLRAMACEEAEALDGAAFLARMQHAALLASSHGANAADAQELPRLTAPDEPGGPSAAALRWSALPMGMALALMAWMACDLMGASAMQWSSAIDASLASGTPAGGAAAPWIESLASQWAGGVLCAWCAWSVWQLRRWAWGS